jgi:predicted membrane channel-forming protein YqfA (hemolysin III family)
MHDNEYIKTGYRINHNNFKDVFCSVFKCHNETVNIWSHGMGTLLFLIIAIIVICIFPNMEQEGLIGQTYYEQLLINNRSLTPVDYMQMEI